ncbi:MAG: hypothetical protein QM708_12155 [Propioniciclava sp.]|uniref:hypothetical protein n=1 Tax=Propioniciclava sp. TaxID=2038686 RepID=UPI0039E61536
MIDLDQLEAISMAASEVGDDREFSRVFSPGPALILVREARRWRQERDAARDRLQQWVTTRVEASREVTLDDIRRAPLGSVYTDTTGDVWMLEALSNIAPDAWMVSPKTSPRRASEVLQKWGPLTLRWSPDCQGGD